MAEINPYTFKKIKWKDRPDKFITHLFHARQWASWSIRQGLAFPKELDLFRDIAEHLVEVLDSVLKFITSFLIILKHVSHLVCIMDIDSHLSQLQYRKSNIRNRLCNVWGVKFTCARNHLENAIGIWDPVGIIRSEIRRCKDRRSIRHRRTCSLSKRLRWCLHCCYYDVRRWWVYEWKKHEAVIWIWWGRGKFTHAPSLDHLRPPLEWNRHLCRNLPHSYSSEEATSEFVDQKLQYFAGIRGGGWTLNAGGFVFIHDHSWANQNCVGIVRPFLISLLCVLIMRQNRHCNDDGHFVVPSPEASPYSFHRQQAIRADDHAGPSTAAKDPEGHPLQGPLFRLSNALCSLSLYQSSSPSPIILGHLVSCIDGYQCRSHRQPQRSNRQSPAEGNRCSSLDNRHLGPTFLPRQPPIHLFWMPCNGGWLRRLSFLRCHVVSCLFLPRRFFTEDRPKSPIPMAPAFTNPVSALQELSTVEPCLPRIHSIVNLSALRLKLSISEMLPALERHSAGGMPCIELASLLSAWYEACTNLQTLAMITPILAFLAKDTAHRWFAKTTMFLGWKNIKCVSLSFRLSCLETWRDLLPDSAIIRRDGYRPIFLHSWIISRHFAYLHGSIYALQGAISQPRTWLCSPASLLISSSRIPPNPRMPSILLRELVLSLPTPSKSKLVVPMWS